MANTVLIAAEIVDLSANDNGKPGDFTEADIDSFVALEDDGDSFYYQDSTVIVSSIDGRSFSVTWR